MSSCVSRRPVESHSRTRETIIAGPSPPHFVCAEIEREETYREGCPLTIQLGVWGSIVSSPSGVRGGAPAENGFYAYLRSERSHMEHPFQYFWAMAGPPNVAGPGKTSPLPPSRRAWQVAHNCVLPDCMCSRPQLRFRLPLEKFFAGLHLASLRHGPAIWDGADWLTDVECLADTFSWSPRSLPCL